MIELQSIIEKYEKSIIQSEAEVRSKLIVPIIEALGYPSEFRSEEFPVYGFEGGKKLHAKNADFLLFDDKDFAIHREYSKKNIDWVQTHSLLVVETKKPGEMPEVMGQAQFYSHWAKAIAYLVTDGKTIKGYMRNPISADSEWVDCKVSDLQQSEGILKFTYQNIEAIKGIDFSKEIEDRLSAQKDKETPISSSIGEFPPELVDFIRITMGNESKALSNDEVVDRFFNIPDFSHRDVLASFVTETFGVPERIVNKEEALLYLDEDVFPSVRGTVTEYQCLHTKRIVFENEIVFIEATLCCDETIGYRTGYHVLDYKVEKRIYNLNRAKRILFSKSFHIRDEQKKEIIADIETDSLKKNNIYYIADMESIDYWLSRMDQLKVIEEYYGIEFTLRAIKSAEETAKLYTAVETVYDGIIKEENIFFSEEDKKRFREIGIDESLSIKCDVMKTIIWEEIEIHGIRFIPDVLSIIPQGDSSYRFSVEFRIYEEEGNG